VNWIFIRHLVACVFGEDALTKKVSIKRRRHNRHLRHHSAE